MDKNLKEQIKQWSYTGKYDLIIDTVENLPASEVDFFIAHRLALAYNNTNRLQDSIDLLTRFKEEGENDPVWNYYLGYALLFLGKKQEARGYLLRAREIDSRMSVESILRYCICYDGSPDNTMNDVSLNRWLCEWFGGTPDGNATLIPDLGIKLAASIGGLKSNGTSSATLNFYTDLQSGESFYECCVGLGRDQRDAVSSALENFYAGFYSGIHQMMRSRQALTELTDQHSRIWKVYASNVVGMGNPPGVSTSFYWELLEKAVPDYLGNKTIVYLKLYGAKHNDFITAECRVNDTVSHNLSDLLHHSVLGWENEGFVSHKQFFFLVCENVGEQYPYSQEQINQHVKTAVELFSDPDTNYDAIFRTLANLIGDASLANELHGFIPELCAERAFDKIVSPDQISISTGGEPAEYNKWQISAYHMISAALDQGFHNKAYPENAFRNCVQVSSTYGAICKAQEDGVDLAEKGASIRHYYNFHKGYGVR